MALIISLTTVDWKKQFTDSATDAIKELAGDALDKAFDIAVDELLKQLNIDTVRLHYMRYRWCFKKL